MKYFIGAGIAMILQALLIGLSSEFYLHVAPDDNALQVNGTLIEFEGLNGR